MPGRRTASQAAAKPAARGAALYAPSNEDSSHCWPRGRPADGGDDGNGQRADDSLSNEAAELLAACEAEPDGERRLVLARRAYDAAPRARKARRAYALTLATTRGWGRLAELLEMWDIPSTFGDDSVAARAAACCLRFASRYGAAELVAPADVALGAAQMSAKRAGDAFFAVGHFGEAAAAYGRGLAIAAHLTLACDRAAAFVEAGDFAGALASYDAAVDAYPSCWRCRWARARCACTVAVRTRRPGLCDGVNHVRAGARFRNRGRRRPAPRDPAGAGRGRGKRCFGGRCATTPGAPRRRRRPRGVARGDRGGRRRTPNAEAPRPK